MKDAKSLEAITLANQDKPVLGLFHDGNMAVAWEGPKATYQGNLKNPPLECKPNSKLDPNAPTLAQMTKKAIDLLKTNENGFSYKSKAPPLINKIIMLILVVKLVKRWH